MATMIAPVRFPALEADLFSLAASVRPSVVVVRDGDGRGGAGVVWDESLVITNHHVVRSDSCGVVFASGEQANAQVVARDSEHDLVALEFPLTGDERPAPLARRTARPLRPGELVIALGHPVGVEWALTVGVLTGVPDEHAPRGLLRASITLQPGNSGGPLLDARGEMIGVNAMLTGRAEAIAIPVPVVDRFVQGAKLAG